MKPYIAELVGMFVLVLGGVGSAVLAGSHIGFVGVAFAFGLSLLAMVYTIGPISGCHINPAVTLGLFLAGKFPGTRVPGYWAAHIIGAILAAAILYLIAEGQPHFSAVISGFGSNGYGVRSLDHFTLGAAFLSEIVMTAFLVLTVLGATDIKAPVGFAGVAIGLVLTLIHLVQSRRQHLGQSGAQHRSRALRGRRGHQPALAVHHRAADRRRGGGGHLFHHPGGGADDHRENRRTGAPLGTGATSRVLRRGVTAAPA